MKCGSGFSALQRAEIAEIETKRMNEPTSPGFSALQRAEIAEIVGGPAFVVSSSGFSALQRAEIAEMSVQKHHVVVIQRVSVLFNEPKLLKSKLCNADT